MTYVKFTGNYYTEALSLSKDKDSRIADSISYIVEVRSHRSSHKQRATGDRLKVLTKTPSRRIMGG